MRFKYAETLFTRELYELKVSHCIPFYFLNGMFTLCATFQIQTYGGPFLAKHNSEHFIKEGNSNFCIFVYMFFSQRHRNCALDEMVATKSILTFVVVVYISLQLCCSAPRSANSVLLRKAPDRKLISRQNVPMLHLRKRRKANKNAATEMQVGMIQIKNLEVRDGILRNIMIKPISK